MVLGLLMRKALLWVFGVGSEAARWGGLSSVLKEHMDFIGVCVCVYCVGVKWVCLCVLCGSNVCVCVSVL